MEISPAASAELAGLTRRMSTGDDAAWQTFHDEYGPILFRILLAGTRGDPHLAAEARQRAYLRIARHVRVCDQPAMWLAWLRTVAHSALSDARRRDRSFADRILRRATEPDVTPTAAEESDLFTTLDAALAGLPAVTRALIEAKYLHGKSVTQLAGELDLTPKAVESRLTRAREELRSLLANARRSIAP
jgi:RNA polymerase sigma-70 factor (ECF subfamily)